ncbi:unnamed protein product [Effrenium voratum]|nr:unnamed protein product [Effrenium voratum]
MIPLPPEMTDLDQAQMWQQPQEQYIFLVPADPQQQCMDPMQGQCQPMRYMWWPQTEQQFMYQAPVMQGAWPVEAAKACWPEAKPQAWPEAQTWPEPKAPQQQQPPAQRYSPREPQPAVLAAPACEEVCNQNYTPRSTEVPPDGSEAERRLSASAARRLRRKRAAERARHGQADEEVPLNLEDLKQRLVSDPNSAARRLRHHVYTLSRDAMGCRLVQEVIDKAGSREAVDVAQELQGHVLETSMCPHGNYVVQKVVSHLSVASSRFVAEELKGHAVRAAKHRFACRILCRLLEFCGKGATSELVEELLEDAATLCTHSYAHHVIQSVLEHGEASHKQRIAEALLSDSFRFATHKHSSYLIEKALSYCDSEAFITELGAPQMLLKLAMEQYGCYVARALLQDERVRTPEVIQLLQRNRGALEAKRHGQRFLADVGLDT